MAQITSSVAEHFSLTRGGPFHWLLVRLRNEGDDRRLVVRRALTAIMKSAMEGRPRAGNLSKENLAIRRGGRKDPKISQASSCRSAKNPSA